MSKKPVDTAVELMVGPCIDDGDFKTRESIAFDAAGVDVSFYEEVIAGMTVTALTLTSAGAQDWVDEGEGYHSVEITAAQNNSEGVIWVGGVFTGVLPFESPHYECVPIKVYNSLVAGSDALEVDLIEINGAAQTATLDDIEGQTDDIGVAGAGLSAIPWNSNWDTEVESEVADALIALGLDHLISESVTGTDVVDDSIIAKLVSKEATADWDDFVNTTESLQALRDWIGDGTNLDEAGGDGAQLTEAGGTGDQLSALPTAAENADAVHEESLEDHLTEGTAGFAQMLLVYQGEYGPGIYCDSGAANTNTVPGTDGTEKNPVSTLAAARTLADAIGLRAYYIEDNSSFTLAATHEDWEFFGLGSVVDNTINLGSQDVDRSVFINLTIEGVQGGTERIELDRCAIQDVSGAPVTTLHVIAKHTGFVDQFEVDTSNDNEFIDCFSQVAGAATPTIIATGAAGTLAFRRYSGGIELKSLSASHNVSIEGMGQVVFNADCNVNANVSIRGLFTITDNTAGMNSVTRDAVFDHNVILNDWKNDGRLDVILDAIKAVTDDWAEGERLDLILDLIAADADELQVDWTNDGRLDVIVDAIKAVTDNLPNSGALTNLDAAVSTRSSHSVSDLLTTALADVYAANGAAPTLQQAIMAIHQGLFDFSITTTVVTVEKVGGGTAFLVTLDSATVPTSANRL